MLSVNDCAQRCAEYVYILDLFFNLDFLLNYVASNGLEIALFWKILPTQCDRVCGGSFKQAIFSTMLREFSDLVKYQRYLHTLRITFYQTALFSLQEKHFSIDNGEKVKILKENYFTLTVQSMLMPQILIISLYLSWFTCFRQVTDVLWHGIAKTQGSTNQNSEILDLNLQIKFMLQLDFLVQSF